MSASIQNENTHLRGAQIGTREAIADTVEGLRNPSDPGIYWGGLKLPTEDATRHFCVMGATGSGKTVLLRLLMQSVLPRVDRKSQPQQESLAIPPVNTGSLDDPAIQAAKNVNPWHVSLNGCATYFIGVFMSLGLVAVISDFRRILEREGIWAVGGMLLAGLIAVIWTWSTTVDYFKDGVEKSKLIEELKSCTDFKKALGLAYKIDSDKYLKAITPKPAPSSQSNPKAAPASPKVDVKTRVLIYDAKQDAASLIRAINPGCKLIILNPFDKRCAAWDMAADITKPSTAQQVATLLIPENPNASQPFFTNAARHILGGVIQAFMVLNPGKWTFRDVVLATKSRQRLVTLLQKTPHTKDLIGQYFGNETTVGSILSELATHMGPYEHIAAAWSKATEKVSLSQWIKGESILILGNDEAHRAALDAINRLLFQRLTEIILAQPETRTEQTWIFLDEVREAGELEGLSRLLNKGRSKGACVVLGFQDIEGMRAVYGDKVANEIVGQCNHMALLRLNSPETAKWASDRIGDSETIDEDESFQEGTSDNVAKSSSHGSTGGWIGGTNSQQSGKTTTTGTSSSTTRNKKKVIKAVVLPSEFLSLPLTNRANGLSGFFIIPQIRAGAYYGEIPGDELFPADKTRAVLIAPDPNFADFEERKAEDEYLDPWNDEELQALGFASTAPEASSGASSAASPAASPTPVSGTTGSPAKSTDSATASPDSPPVSPKKAPGAAVTGGVAATASGMPKNIRRPKTQHESKNSPVPQADPEKTARLQELLDRRNR